MNKTRFFGILALVLVFAASLGFAECTVSSLTTSAVSAAQVGNSVTVTVTYSGSGCSGQQLYLDTSSGLTGSPSYRTIGSDSGTTTFTITASVAATYTYNARLSTTQSTPASIEFVSPDVLTVLPSSNPSSVTGQSVNRAFTITIYINNPSAADISTTYSFTYDSSSISMSGTTGSLSVNAGETTTLTKSATPTTYFSGEEIAFNLGSNDGAFTTTVSTVSRSISDSSTQRRTAAEEENETVNATTTATTTPSTQQQTGTGTGTTEGQQGQPSQQPTGVNEKTEAQSAINDASLAVSQAMNDGKDLRTALAKLAQAQDALAQGDYAKAKQLADEAKQLALSATKQVKTTAPSTTTAPGATPTGEKPKTDYTIFILAAIAIVIVVGIIVAAYILKKKKY